jgi:hypothetical protein
VLRVILDEDNDIPNGGPGLGQGIDSVASALRAEFSTQTGEWPYDKTFGCPYRSGQQDPRHRARNSQSDLRRLNYQRSRATG